MTVTITDWTVEQAWTMHDEAHPFWEPTGPPHSDGSPSDGYALAAGDPTRNPVAFDVWTLNIHLPVLTLPAGATDQGFTIDWKWGWDSTPWIAPQGEGGFFGTGRPWALIWPASSWTVHPIAAMQVALDPTGTALATYLAALAADDHNNAVNGVSGHPEIIGGMDNMGWSPSNPFPMTTMTGAGQWWTFLCARGRERDHLALSCSNPPRDWDGLGPSSVVVKHAYTLARTTPTNASATVHMAGVV